MAKINIANGIISSSADYGLYRGTSKIVNIQDGEFRVLGDLIAENYIVSSSVSNIEYQSLSGSTIFGDSADDTHQFTGSLKVEGNIRLGATSPKVYFNDAETFYVGWNNSTRLIFGVNGDDAFQFVQVGTDGDGMIEVSPYTSNHNYPAYTFSGDNNTGVTSLSADTLALVGGGTARLHVASGSGNIGIGTTSPEEKLHIKETDSSFGNTTLHIENAKSDDAAVLILEGARTSTNDTAQISFMNSGDVGAAIKAFSGHGSNNDSGEIQFSVSEDGTASSLTTAMTIDTNARVGIGTVSPTYELDVVGDIGINEYIRHNDDTDTYFRFTADTITMRAGGDDQFIQSLNAIEFPRANLKVSGSATSTGSFGQVHVAHKMGIMTTTPGSVAANGFNGTKGIIEIRSSASGADAALLIRRFEGDGVYGMDLWTDTNAAHNYIDSRGNLDAANLYIRTRTHGTPKNNIIAYGTGNVTFEAGYVGIGTDSPAQALDISGSLYVHEMTKDALIRVYANGDFAGETRTAGIVFGGRNGSNEDSTSDYRAGMFSRYNGDLWITATSGTGVIGTPASSASIYIEGSNKQVGIGTASPDAPLHILGDGGASDPLATMILSSTTNHGGLVVNAPASKQTHIRFQNNGTLKWQMRSPFQDPTNPDSLRFYSMTKSADVVTLLNDGKVGIGTISPDGTLHSHTATAGSVVAHASANEIVAENDNDGGISILTPNNKIGGIFFGDPDDNNVGMIQYSHALNRFAFTAAASSAPGFTLTGNTAEFGASILRISGSATSTGSFGALHIPGRVGIGTTSQNSNLTIQTTGNSLDVAAATGTLQFGSVSGTPTPSITGRQTAGTHALFLLAMGLDGTTTGDMIFNTRENNNSTFGTLTNAGFKFQHFTTDLVTILRNGKVGINVTDPDSMLEVVGGSGATSINAHGVVQFRTTSVDGSELRHQFNMGGASDAGSYVIYQGDASTAGVILNAGDDSYIAGNLGIGETSPTTTLHVKTDTGITIKTAGTTNTPGRLNLWSADTSIAANDTIAAIYALGTDSTSTAKTGSKIEFNADAVWDAGSANYQATRIDFFAQNNTGFKYFNCSSITSSS